MTQVSGKRLSSNASVQLGASGSAGPLEVGLDISQPLTLASAEGETASPDQRGSGQGHVPGRSPSKDHTARPAAPQLKSEEKVAPAPLPAHSHLQSAPGPCSADSSAFSFCSASPSAGLTGDWRWFSGVCSQTQQQSHARSPGSPPHLLGWVTLKATLQC